LQEFVNLDKDFTLAKTNFNTQPNVLDLLNFCKGIAIVWIVLVHYQPGWFGWQGVHIFIVLSGFGLTYSCLKKSGVILWKQWYLRRTEKILPTYWLMCLSGFLIMVCVYIFKRHSVATNILNSAITLILEILSLKSFSYQLMFSPPPNDPLWFIPLIIGFYLIFPWLYWLTIKYKTNKVYLIIFLAVAVSEFIYRAISIYWIDGFPVGFESNLLSVQPLDPLNKLSDTLPFQLQAPFGLFPSRIAEFMLGMLGASLLVQNTQKFHNIFLNYRIGLVGVLIWLAGCSLIFTGLWGWIFADFLIALGLIIWIVNLAGIFQQRFSFLFRKISQLGIWSYYIFLSHGAFIYFSDKVQEKLDVSQSSIISLLICKISLLGFIAVGTWGTSWLLMKFDNSKFPKLIVQKTIGRFLQ
jgi:peptidoglycan/LPS O-acetylase OafA/YrhL